MQKCLRTNLFAFLRKRLKDPANAGVSEVEAVLAS